MSQKEGNFDDIGTRNNMLRNKILARAGEKGWDRECKKEQKLEEQGWTLAGWYI